MKRLAMAACLAAAGISLGGIHSASAASQTGSCVGVATSGSNSLFPGSGGQYNAFYAQLSNAMGGNFGQDVAAHSVGCP